jgi:uncharacterized protein (TIGR02996 family)
MLRVLTGQRLRKFRARFPDVPPIDSEWRARIVADPHDEDLRMVYADWLLERGDPMGELIHVQCRLHALPEDQRAGSARAKLLSRETELLTTVVVRERRWRSLHGWLTHELQALGANRFTIRRGFVASLHIDAARLIEHAAALFALAPITEVSISDARSTHVVELAASPAVSRVTDLEIASSPSSSAVNDRAFTALARSPHLAKLRRLVLRGGRLSRLPGLSGSHPLPSLRELSITEQPLRSVQALTEWPGLRDLERLSMRSCELDDDAIVELVAAPMDHLVELDLSDNRLGVRSARALAAAPRLPKLARLSVESCRLRPQGIEEIVRSAALPSLRELELGEKQVPEATRQKLLRLLARPRSETMRVAARRTRGAR